MRLTSAQVQALTGDAERWLEPLNAALARWEINTPDRAAMFLAQCGHESGGFRRLTENLNYTAAQLLRTWPNRFTADDAAAMALQPEKIAERAYGGRMGNAAEGGGDGWRFRGRGIIQLTGRENYRLAGQALGIDATGNPEQLAEPAVAAQVAGWYWATNGCNALADAGDFEGVTRRINGGLNGYEDRQRWLAKVRAILAADASPDVHKPPVTAPGAGAAADQPKEDSMGAIALPLLAQLLPQVLGLFSQRAQATIAEKTGADPKVAAAFMQNLIAQVGTATGVTVTNDATATQAVAALTALPAAEKAAKVAALEPQALATLDELLRAGDKAAEWDARRWAAELAGRKASSEIAIEEHKAGLWDMTRAVVYFAAITLTGLVFALLAALIYQAVTGTRTIDSGLLGLAGPIFMAAVAAWGAIIAYRFDGTKQSSEQSKALTEVMRERAAR